MATATKSNIALRSPQGAKFAVERFLASMDWNGCGNYRRECVAYGTRLFATDEVVYTEPITQNFLCSLITCRAAQIHTFHSVAPMVVLTSSLIGTEHGKMDWEHYLQRNGMVW